MGRRRDLRAYHTSDTGGRLTVPCPLYIRRYRMGRISCRRIGKTFFTVRFYCRRCQFRFRCFQGPYQGTTLQCEICFKHAFRASYGPSERDVYRACIFHNRSQEIGRTADASGKDMRQRRRKVRYHTEIADKGVNRQVSRRA